MRRGCYDRSWKEKAPSVLYRSSPRKADTARKIHHEGSGKEICQAVADGLNVFITGMARGVDIWAAQIVLMLREEGYDVKLMCACPYDGFKRGWSRGWQKAYREILAAADFVKYVCSGYSRACFQIRNEWMVNHSTRVIAVFNGEKSGTKNTIDYAMKVGVPVVRIEG